eukprot:683798-Pelagomonas_calceolata.AAC.1
MAKRAAHTGWQSVQPTQDGKTVSPHRMAKRAEVANEPTSSLGRAALMKRRMSEMRWLWLKRATWSQPVGPFWSVSLHMTLLQVEHLVARETRVQQLRQRQRSYCHLPRFGRYLGRRCACGESRNRVEKVHARINRVPRVQGHREGRRARELSSRRKNIAGKREGWGRRKNTTRDALMTFRGSLLWECIFKCLAEILGVAFVGVAMLATYSVPFKLPLQASTAVKHHPFFSFLFLSFPFLSFPFNGNLGRPLGEQAKEEGIANTYTFISWKRSRVPVLPDLSVQWLKCASLSTARKGRLSTVFMLITWAERFGEVLGLHA